MSISEATVSTRSNGDAGAESAYGDWRWVCATLAVSRSELARLKKEGSLPAHAVFGPRTHRWKKSTILAWADGLTQRPGNRTGVAVSAATPA